VALAARKTLLMAAIESKSRLMPESLVCTWRSVSFRVCDPDTNAPYFLSRG
jgi:hypothetical protein